jgi:hypothetical protein
MGGKSAGAAGGKKPEPRAITFLCQMCQKQKPLAEMRLVTRFVPSLVVCRDCAKELR